MPIWFHSATPCLAQKTCTGEHFVFLSFECLAYCRCGPERFSPDTEKRLNDAVLTFFFFFAGAHRSSDLQLYGIGCQIGPRVDRQTAELSAELRHLRHMLQVLQLPLVNCHAHDLSCLDKVSPSQGVASRLYFGVCWKDENWGSVLTWIGHH